MTQINVYKERWDENPEDRIFQFFTRRYKATAEVVEDYGYGKRRLTITRWSYTAKGALRKLQKELKVRDEFPDGRKLVQVWAEPGGRVSDD